MSQSNCLEVMNLSYLVIGSYVKNKLDLSALFADQRYFEYIFNENLLNQGT